jgi:hypothetical protein
VDLNEPITLDQEARFCPIGNSLALLFLTASRDAVGLAGIERPEMLFRRVNDALLELLKHRSECQACNAMWVAATSERVIEEGDAQLGMFGKG